MAKAKTTLEPKNTKLRLTELTCKNAPPALAGQRYEYLDTDCRGLALRVTASRSKSFVFRARYPGAGERLVYARRALGTYPETTLDEARDLAAAWRKMLKSGKDPRREERLAIAAEVRERGTTFGAVAADFIERYVPRLRKEKQAAAIINREFVARWKDWPIGDVGPLEAAKAIRAIVARGAKYQAHNAHGYLRRLFNWAIAAGEYGIDTSPMTRLRPGELIGRRDLRDRVLGDVELRRVWRAAYALDYPYCPIVHMLILTGQRLNEVAGMRWAEVDLDRKFWTIPKERMKGGRSHEIPLSDTAVAILEFLPKWKGGACVFTTTSGAKAVNGFSKVKRPLDKTIAAVAVHDDAAEEMPRWVLHDLRRTMRTHLSALPVQDLVRELVIAHAKPGLHKVYDQHAYRDEKRECLCLWETRLRGILTPPAARGDNVIVLPRASA